MGSWERTLTRSRGTIFGGLISERIDLVGLLLFFGSLVISRGGFFLGAFLPLRYGWCCRSVSLGLLAATLHRGVRRGRRGSLALGPAGALGGGLGGWRSAGGLLLGWARALARWPARRRLLLIFDVELQGLVDCMCEMGEMMTSRGRG